MRALGISAISLAMTAAVISNAYYQKKQFYPSVVYITKSNPSMAVSSATLGISNSLGYSASAVPNQTDHNKTFDLLSLPGYLHPVSGFSTYAWETYAKGKLF